MKLDKDRMLSFLDLYLPYFCFEFYIYSNKFALWWK